MTVRSARIARIWRSAAASIANSNASSAASRKNTGVGGTIIRTGIAIEIEIEIEIEIAAERRRSTGAESAVDQLRLSPLAILRLSPLAILRQAEVRRAGPF